MPLLSVDADLDEIDALTERWVAIEQQRMAIRSNWLERERIGSTQIKLLRAERQSLRTFLDDAAQSFGATYKEKIVGNLSEVAATSFFPAKPLGCYGDGGAVFTNNKNYAKKLRALRVHGQTRKNYHKYEGIGGRLDTLQAAVLLVKLKYFSKELIKREYIAKYYTKKLSHILQTPILKPKNTSSWAQYTIRLKYRDKIQKKLKKKGIPTSVFYPVPLHLQECFKFLNYKKGDFPISEKMSKEVLSLPINPFLTNDQIDYIISNIKECIL